MNLIIGFILFFFQPVQGQIFTEKDSLRGNLSPERTWFDINYYHLNLEVYPNTRSIAGYNDVLFTVLEKSKMMQLDMFENMLIDSILYYGHICQFERKYDAFFINFPFVLVPGDLKQIRIYYHGQPIEAKNPPWDGGFVWKEDTRDLPWIGVACQGLGASSWWPCKDHLSDEPDSMRITCSVPSEVQFIGNGNRENDTIISGKRISTWKVSYPINPYNVSINIANYSHLHDEYTGEKGSLSLDYYIMKGNEEKAQKQFKQVAPMLAIYEDLFGPYPFWNDGYALVETPYLGMEHQSAIAYGNKFMPGYLGSFPGEMDFDFIVIHESGHEYWGNSVSMNDISDMWIHESFCTYSEALYVEKIYGHEQMLNYLMYQKDFISGSSPITGHRNVNDKGNPIDMYYKGSWMLHSIRNTLANDSLWFSILKGISLEFALKNCDGEEIISFVNERAGMDFRPLFDQYLNYSTLPVLKYRLLKQNSHYILDYKWSSDVKGFNMPIDICLFNQQVLRLCPSNKYQSISLEISHSEELQFIDNNFLYEKNQE
tara:strand:- start:1031 stop:2656 length:1626 start_codon:yes stop_codon:yes gene_type:complete